MSSPIKPPLDFNVLYWIKHPGIQVINLRFRNVHAFPRTKSRYLEKQTRDVEQPLARVVLQRYAQREELPLWWSCIAAKERGHADRVVRSWLARRTRDAFEDSLKKKGFDTYGRRLPGSGNEADIYGTAYLSVKREAAKISIEDLAKQTDIAVSEIQRSIGRRSKPSVARPKGERKSWAGNRGEKLWPPSKALTRNE